jgi:hypothetical protein
LNEKKIESKIFIHSPRVTKNEHGVTFSSWVTKGEELGKNSKNIVTVFNYETNHFDNYINGKKV